MTPERIAFALTATVLVAVGLFFVLHLGLGSLRRLRAWEARAVRVTATVLRHETRTYKSNTYYHPVVRFVSPAGEKVVFEAERPRRSADPPVGYGLEVLYDPDRPSAARLPGQDRAGALFMIGVGVLFLSVGMVMAVVVLGG
jgi:uncharacterized protein DUF3592